MTGITYPQGFKAAAIYCGIKKKKKDLALLFSTRPAATACLFTTNVVKGASLLFSRRQYQKNKFFRALLVVSGIANCCVGKKGEEDARALASETAHLLKVSQKEVLVGTTGVIGVPLPVPLIVKEMPRLVQALRKEGSISFAKGIMTTDTVPKMTQKKVKLKKGEVRIGGCAKGAGMIAPHLATMFAFLTTDAQIPPSLLFQILKKASEKSFEAITVDGDQSPCDMVLSFANGASHIALENKEERTCFEQAFLEACLELAQGIVQDGEGAKKFVSITVQGAASKQKNKKVALAIANSLLVKTALFGEDPNWGRILTAAGASGVSFNPNRVLLTMNGKVLFQEGAPTYAGLEPPSFLLHSKEITIFLDLGGKSKESFTLYTTDLSYDYVRINAEYHT